MKCLVQKSHVNYLEDGMVITT